LIVSGYGSAYDLLLSICCGSFIIRLSEMSSSFAPTSFVNASRRVCRIRCWSSVESAFSFATRQMFSFGMRFCSGAMEVGWKGMDLSF
jgi:hypothetical protein